MRHASAGVALAIGSSTFAATINVPADWPTIQQAIGAAVDGDEVLVDAGTYTETLDLLGKAITAIEGR